MSDRNGKKSSAAYGYVTLVGTEPILVKPNENIHFNEHGSIKNIRFSRFDGTLTVLKSGDYKIEYTLLIDGPASTSVYGIFLNHSLEIHLMWTVEIHKNRLNDMAQSFL